MCSNLPAHLLLLLQGELVLFQGQPLYHFLLSSQQDSFRRLPEAIPGRRNTSSTLLCAHSRKKALEQMIICSGKILDLIGTSVSPCSSVPIQFILAHPCASQALVVTFCAFRTSKVTDLFHNVEEIWKKSSKVKLEFSFRIVAPGQWWDTVSVTVLVTKPVRSKAMLSITTCSTFKAWFWNQELSSPF